MDTPRVRPFDRRPPGVEWGDYHWHHGTTLAQVRKILMGQRQKRRSKFRAGWARSLPGLYFSRAPEEASRYAAGHRGTEAVLHVRGIPPERQELDEDEVTLLVPPDTSSLTARIAESRRLDLPLTRTVDLGLRRLRASGVVPITSMRVLGRLFLVVEAVRMGRGWVEVWARWEEGAERGRLARVAPRRGRAAVGKWELEERLDAHPERAQRLLRKLGGERIVLPSGEAIWRLWALVGGRGGDWVVEESVGGGFSVVSVEDFVWDADVETVFPDEEQRFHDDFWSRPPELYHATTEDHVRGIERHGLELRGETRGVSNRWTGLAVFTTTNEDEALEAAYGEVVYAINTAVMKRDGYTPRVAEEGPIRQYELRRRLAHLLDVEMEFDVEPGLSLSTVVVFGAIPAKYLRRIP